MNKQEPDELNELIVKYNDLRSQESYDVRKFKTAPDDYPYYEELESGLLCIEERAKDIGIRILEILDAGGTGQHPRAVARLRKAIEREIYFDWE